MRGIRFPDGCPQAVRQERAHAREALVRPANEAVMLKSENDKAVDI